MKVLINFMLLILLPSCSISYGNYSSSPNPSILSLNASHHLPQRSRKYPEIGKAKIIKKGKACVEGYPIANSIVYDNLDKSSIDKAMEDGKIKNLAIIDYESTQLGLFGYVIYAEECILAYGE